MTFAIQRARARLRRATRRSSWLPLLVLRVCLGGLFLSTGWGKVHNLTKVTGFFAELGIPAPSASAALVGYSELICGALLLVGLASRLATVPLMTTMIVALLTALRDEIHGLPDLFGQIEFTYLTMLFAVVVMGPGSASIDGALALAVDRSRPRAPAELESAYAP